jgi:hypothetical protein
MENDPQHIVAERDSAKAHCDSLTRKYDIAAEKLYSSGSDADLITCFIIGDVLMDARDRLEALEAVITRNQQRIEDEGPSYEEQQQQLAVFNPYSYLTFNRYTLYTYLVVFGIVAFILLCMRIGW